MNSLTELLWGVYTVTELGGCALFLDARTDLEDEHSDLFFTTCPTMSQVKSFTKGT